MARNAKKMQKKLLGERKICVLLFMNLKHKIKNESKILFRRPAVGRYSFGL